MQPPLSNTNTKHHCGKELTHARFFERKEKEEQRGE
jgi:hypothetical protein